MSPENLAKPCTRCKTVKTLDDFYTDNRRVDSKGTLCKVCHEARYKNWKRANRQKVLGYNKKWYESSGVRFKRFGLTEQQYTEMLERQGGACAICLTPEKTIVRGRVIAISIDHDHAIGGGVRGLLCNACNTGIGKFGDNPDLLEAAARYVRAYRKPRILPTVG